MVKKEVVIEQKQFTDKATGEVKRFYEMSVVLNNKKFILRPIESQRAFVNYVLDEIYE